MRLHHFHLVILSDGFDETESSRSPVVNYLNHVSMSVRRKVFLVLIGDNFVTMDQMMAYSVSANLVVNRKDIQKLDNVLKRGISDHEQFYKVLMDTLVEVRKA